MTAIAAHYLRRAVFSLLVLVATLPAQGRIIKVPTTDELEASAPIICNGKVTELTNTLKKSTVVYPFLKTFIIPTEIWTAKIKVLKTFKGKLPDEIEVRFPQRDAHPKNDEETVETDGPFLISMELNARYRLYLKPVPGQKWYVGIFDGNFDEAYAVHPMDEEEADDNPALLKDEAIKLATDYVKKIKPDATFTQWNIYASEESKPKAPRVPSAEVPFLPQYWNESTSWRVVFNWSHDYEFGREPDATIWIPRSREIAPESWVNLQATEVNPSHVGRTVHIYFKYPLKDGFADYYSLVGQIEKVDAQNLELSNVQEQAADKDKVPRKWPTLPIPIGDIEQVSFLGPQAKPAEAGP